MVLCMVERSIRGMGLRGVMGGKAMRTVIGVMLRSPSQTAEPIAGQLLHPLPHLAGPVIRDLPHRRVRPSHRGLAGK